MKTYYPTINLLRAIAALMVCWYHFIGYNDIHGPIFQKDSWMLELGQLGINGVYVFFVISGFVITLALSKENFTLNQMPRFLLRRFIRIEIPYLISILLIILVGYLFSLKNNSTFEISATQLFYHVTYLIPFSNYEWYNPIYWTLAIEFQFYIVIALLCLLFFNKNKVITIVTILLFGASAFITTDTRLIFHYSTIFLMGILLFLISAKKIDSVLGIIFTVLSIVATAYLHSVEIAAFGSLTLLCIHFVEINKKITNQLGEISFSLYLTHGLVGVNLLYFFSRYMTNGFEKGLLIAGGFALSLLFSYIYWRIIENPARELSKKIILKK